MNHDDHFVRSIFVLHHNSLPLQTKKSRPVSKDMFSPSRGQNGRAKWGPWLRAAPPRWQDMENHSQTRLSPSSTISTTKSMNQPTCLRCLQQRTHVAFRGCPYPYGSEGKKHCCGPVCLPSSWAQDSGRPSSGRRAAECVRIYQRNLLIHDG